MFKEAKMKKEITSKFIKPIKLLLKSGSYSMQIKPNQFK